MSRNEKAAEMIENVELTENGTDTVDEVVNEDFEVILDLPAPDDTFIVIVASNTKLKQAVKIPLKVGKTLADLVECYGEETIRDMAIKRLTIGIQNSARLLIGKSTPADIQAALEGWKPGNVVRAKVDNLTVTENTLKNMDTADIQALLKKMGIAL